MRSAICFLSTLLFPAILLAEVIHLNQPSINLGALAHDGHYFEPLAIERTSETPEQVTVFFVHAKYVCSGTGLVTVQGRCKKKKGVIFPRCTEYFEPHTVEKCAGYTLDSGNKYVEPNSVILDFSKAASLSSNERETFKIHVFLESPPRRPLITYEAFPLSLGANYEFKIKKPWSLFALEQHKNQTIVFQEVD